MRADAQPLEASRDLTATEDCEVSVLMAVRNGEAYLRETLDSLFAQTLRRFELVVVDDASGDDTPEILRQYAMRDARLRVIRNESQLRLPASLNRGLAECRAPLVARADADDLYLPHRLEVQRDFMAAHPEVGALSCGYYRVTDDGRVLETKVPLTGDEQIRFRMLFMNCFLHPGVMFRAELVRRAGGYDMAYWTAQDTDLWARLLPLTRLENIEEPLVRYRVHDKSISKTRGEEGQRLSLSVPRRLLSDYLGRDVSFEQTRAMTRLYQGFARLPLAEARLGLRGLREVARVARARESEAVRRAFAEKVGESLAKQAALSRSMGSRTALAFRAEAFLWQPGAATARNFAWQLAGAVSQRARRRPIRIAANQSHHHERKD